MFVDQTTNRLYVGDRGTNDRIYRIDFTTTPPTVDPLAGLNEVVIGHRRDSNGNLFYVSSLESCFNKGRFRSLAADDITVTNPWRTIGTSTDAIWTKAIGVNPADLNQIYVSVARQGCSGSNAHTIRRVKQFGPGDNQYGNTNFNFPMGAGNPLSGAVFDSAGILYATNGAEIWKIESDSVASILVSGFSSLAGLDILEVGAVPYLLAADRGAGTVYLINTGTGSFEEVASGLNSPRAVAFSLDPTTGRRSYLIAEPDRLLRFPDPIIELPDVLGAYPVKLLLTNAEGASNGGWPPLQENEGEIPLAFTVHPAGAVDVYVGLGPDPRDTAPYAPTAATDNRAPNTVTITGPGVTVVTAGQEWKVRTGANGQPQKGVVFQVDPNTPSGNNYVLQFSLDDFATGVAQETKPLTVWKRYFYEADLMYESGSDITADVSGGDPTIQVEDTSGFGANEAVIIWDRKAGSSGLFYTATVTPLDSTNLTVAGGSPAAFPLYDGAVPLHPTVTITSTILAPLNPALIYTAHMEAFVEWGSTSKNPNPLIPSVLFFNPPADPFYVGNAGNYLDARVEHFFHHGKWGPVDSRDDYIQIVYAKLFNKVPLSSAIHQVYAVTAGNTVGASGWTTVFRDEILRDFTTPGDLELVQANTAAHEVGHHFNINDCTAPLYGHCAQMAWCSGSTCSGDKCLMNGNRANSDRLKQEGHFHVILTDPPTGDMYNERDHVASLRGIIPPGAFGDCP